MVTKTEENVVDQEVAVPAGDTPAEEPEQHEELVVSIGDEPAAEPVETEQPAPLWVKKVRQRNRELEKELRDTRRKLQETTSTHAAEPELGVKPTLQGHDYDTEKYEQALASWFDRKRKADERISAAKAEQDKADKDWQSRLETYQEAKASFKAEDFDEVESVTLEMLDPTQQGIIVHGAVEPTLLIYALGKNEAKVKELAAIKDPVKFAFAVAKLEATLKVSTRKPLTAPEGRVTGNSRPSGAIDSTLDRLREEASRTGDFTKVTAYKRSKRS